MSNAPPSQKALARSITTAVLSLVWGEGNGAADKAGQGWQRRGKPRGRWSLCTQCNKGWEWDAEIKKRQVFYRECGHAYAKPANPADPKLEYQRMELKAAKASGDQRSAA